MDGKWGSPLILDYLEDVLEFIVVVPGRREVGTPPPGRPLPLDYLEDVLEFIVVVPGGQHVGVSPPSSWIT